MPKYSYFSDEQLITLISSDDEQAFGIIDSKFRQRLYTLSMKYLRKEVLAEEAVQDILTKVWTNRKKFSTNTSLEAWIFTVAKYYLINRFKQEAHNWILTTELTEANTKIYKDLVFDSIKEKEYNRSLEEAIELLPKRQKEIFKLSRYEDYTYPQIAEMFHTSPLTVKKQMSVALQSIKTYLRKKGSIFIFF